MDVLIFKGNREKFCRKIKSIKNQMSFEELVTLTDNIKIFSNYKENIELAFSKYLDSKVNIISYTNSYSSITEGGIQGMAAIVSPLQKYIEGIYLQNPPKVIEDSVLRDSLFNCTEEVTAFDSISLEKLMEMKDTINTRIIGQTMAKKEILVSLYKKIRLDDGKPIVLMLYGPSGVGKTETAKFISQTLNGKNTFFRKQMSMLSSNEYFTYIFGGKHNEITLSKELLERKSNVILFDEFDKCSSVFYSSFYQMFDEGYYEDRNYKVDLSNAIIICTSNFKNTEEIRKTVGDPIFYRFDKLIEYKDLSLEEQKQIIKLIISNQYQNFSDSEKKEISLDSLINSYTKLLVGKLKNFRQAEKIISDGIWNELFDKNYTI